MLTHIVRAVLGRFGFAIARIQNPDHILDPAARSIARGLSAQAHNSRDNMDAFYADPGLHTHYFTPERLEFYRQVRERVSRLGLQPAAVLDAGCGAGQLLAEVAKVFPDASLHGVDFSSQAVKLARQLNPAASVAVGSVLDLDKGGRQFDLVMCTEVLEHLEDADLAMQQLCSVCTPGGTLVVTVPNGRRDTFEGHLNFWTPESFRREFREMSPRIEEFGSYLFVAIRA